MDLRVFLKLDGSGFRQGLTSATQGISQWSGQLKNQIAGAFTVGALAAFSKRTIDFAGHMSDLAARLRVNVEWLQKMNNAAGQAGASVDDLSNFMLEVSRSRQAALENPQGKEAAAFGRMGMSGSLSTASPQQFFEQMIAAYANGASVQMDNDVQEVGGRSAKKLIAAFASGFDDSGPVIPEDMIDQLDQLGDEMFIMKQTLMADLAPAIIWVTKKVRDFFDTIKGTATFWGALFGGLSSGMGVSGSWEEAQRQTNSFNNETINREDAAKIAMERARERRRAIENAAPDFAAGGADRAPTGRASAKAFNQSNGPLVSVGNFLGSSGAVIESIGKETNSILREHTILLKTLASNSTKRGADLGIPA